MLEVVIGILLISITTYTVLAGADLGTGILEIFTSKRTSENNQENLSIHALKPVWEVNHIWLGLSVIIVFIVFPKAFYQIFTSFVFPVLFLFAGLFVRGFSFTLKSNIKYAHNISIKRLFDYSSLWSTFWIGNLVGALIQGNVTLESNDFYPSFIQSWLSIFPTLTGLFLVALFAFIAAIFLHTETDDKALHSILRRRAINANIAAVIIGALVFIYAFMANEGITFYFLQSQTSMFSFATATVLLISTYLFLRTNSKFILKLLASGQIILILIGLFGAQFPIIFQSNLDRIPRTFTFYNSIAQNSSLTTVLAIVILSVLVTIPAYFYLYKVYNNKLKDLYKPLD